MNQTLTIPGRKPTQEISSAIDVHKQATAVIDAVANGQSEVASQILTELAEHSEEELPARFLLQTANALQTGDWDFFPKEFSNLNFVGKNEQFLLVAPYSIRRLSQTTTEMSAIFGQILPHDPIEKFSFSVNSLFGELRQKLPLILPVQVFAGAGLFGQEAGEAFIVPNGWIGVENGEGPALNDMGEQRRRFQHGGVRCIRTIFDEISANLLIMPLQEENQAIQIQHNEYQWHDIGHATGLGLTYKLEQGVLLTSYFGAVEEARADGVAFELASRPLSRLQASQLLASNFCTRFGIDAHRAGGIERDTDVNAALITFNFLLESNALRINKNGQLSFVDPTPNGLVQSVEQMSAWAMDITRQELRLSFPTGIHQLYSSIGVSRAAVTLFEGHVTSPCKGFFPELK